MTYASSLRTDTRYTPSDVFETFPLPENDGPLWEAGEHLESVRSEIMLRRQFGLTKLYNLVNDVHLTNDEDIVRLRKLHAELDKAVAGAYGWDDIELHHGFYTYQKVERWTVCPDARQEILDRLLEENHRRAMAQTESRVLGKSKRMVESKRVPQLIDAQEKMF